jgi:hypothetical protein
MMDINVNVQDAVVVLEQLKDGEYNVIYITEPRRLGLHRQQTGRADVTCTTYLLHASACHRLSCSGAISLNTGRTHLPS